MARKVTIALLQSRAAETPEAALERTQERVEAAARGGAQLIVTQELFRTRYLCQQEEHARFALAEPIPGPATEALGGAARRLGVVIVASLFERRAAGVYHNTAAVLDADGKLAGVYRKMHIPDDPLYQEKFYFTPGEASGFRAFDTAVGRIGVIICWDQWYPEAARLTALAGAEILCLPTAIGWHRSEKAEWGARQLDAWVTAQRAHAIANGIFVAAPNRVGTERDVNAPREGLAADGIEFWGNSFIADPSGQILARGGEREEETVTARCDLDLVEQTRQHWPFLRDRRIDAYGDLVRRWRD